MPGDELMRLSENSLLREAGGADKMAEWAKAATAKPEEQNPIPMTSQGGRKKKKKPAPGAKFGTHMSPLPINK